MLRVRAFLSSYVWVYSLTQTPSTMIKHFYSPSFSLRLRLFAKFQNREPIIMTQWTIPSAHNTVL